MLAETVCFHVEDFGEAWSLLQSLQLVNHLIKQFSGFRAVGVLKVVFYTDLNHDGFQVAAHTVEVEQGFGGDGCGGEHQHLQAFQALSANLCCHLLVDFTHMVQLQHLQAHAIPRQ